MREHSDIEIYKSTKRGIVRGTSTGRVWRMRKIIGSAHSGTQRGFADTHDVVYVAGKLMYTLWPKSVLDELISTVHKISLSLILERAAEPGRNKRYIRAAIPACIALFRSSSS